jgi:hypothetical protein
MSRPTKAETAIEPTVLTNKMSPRSPTGAPKLWRMEGQAVPSIPSGRPTATNVARLKRSNVRSVPATALGAAGLAAVLRVQHLDPGRSIWLQRLVVGVTVRDECRDDVDWSDEHRPRRSELVVIGEGDDRCGPVDHCSLDVRLLEIVGGHPQLRVQTADSEQDDISTDHPQRIDRLGPDGDQSIATKHAADDGNFDPTVLAEGDRDRRARRHDGRAQIRPQCARDLNCRRSAVKDDDLTVIDEFGGASRDRRLRLGSATSPCCERCRITGPRQRPAVHTTQQAELIEFAEISPNRVRGHPKLATQVIGEHPPALAEKFDNGGVTFRGQHLPKRTRICTFLPISAFGTPRRRVAITAIPLSGNRASEHRPLTDELL